MNIEEIKLKRLLLREMKKYDNDVTIEDARKYLEQDDVDLILNISDLAKYAPLSKDHYEKLVELWSMVENRKKLLERVNK